MSRATLALVDTATRERLADWAYRLPRGTRVELKAPKRTLPQNDRMWLILTEVSRQLLWPPADPIAQRYKPEEWKDFFMHAYKGHKLMPSEDGRLVPIGRSTSDLSKEEHGELMTLMEAFCARHDVTLPWDEP